MRRLPNGLCGGGQPGAEQRGTECHERWGGLLGPGCEAVRGVRPGGGLPSVLDVLRESSVLGRA